MGFTRDGSYYYGVRTGMSDVYIAEVDLASGRVLAQPDSGHRSALWVPTAGPTGRLTAGSSCTFRSAVPGCGEPGRYASETPKAARCANSPPSSTGWSCVRWFPDGRSLLAGARASTVISASSASTFRPATSSGVDLTRIPFGYPAGLVPRRQDDVLSSVASDRQDTV